MAALPPLATEGDLGAWIGQDITSSTDVLRAGAVLSAASALVRSYCGETWADSVPDVVTAVTVQVAARVWNNPDGLTSVTVDDSTRRWSDSSGSLYLTDADKAALAPHRAGGGSSNIGTISTAGGSTALDTVYVPTSPAPSGYPFPWYSTEDRWP